MTALAVGLAALAVWVLVRPGDAGLARHQAQPPEQAGAGAPWSAAVIPGLLAVVTLAGLAGGPRAAVVAVALGLVAGCGWVLASRLLARRRRAARRAEVAWAGQVLAGLLRAGHVPATALVAAASECGVLRTASDTQAVGGPVPAALRRAASEAGLEGLGDLGDAWAVAERTGASLCDAVAATAEQLAGKQEVARSVAAELAAPRATGRVMAVLPVAGMLLGFGIGGNPLVFLVGHPAGWACLVAGVALACVGVLWTEALADRAGGD